MLVVTLLSANFALRQPPIYESTATFVVRPRLADTAEAGDLLRAFDTLTRGVEISSTYAAIARSGLIRQRALELLGPSAGAGLRVDADAVTGTSVMELVVSGPDPQQVHDMATAVGAETVEYVDTLQDAFELAPLDSPQLPTEPVGPNVPLIVGTGVVFGLGLGLVLAFLAEGLQVSLGKKRERDRLARRLVRPDMRGGFLEGLADALRSNQPVSVGIVRVTPGAGTESTEHGGDSEFFNVLTLERMPALHGDEMPTYLGDGTFALMRTDTAVEEMGAFMRAWAEEIREAAAAHDSNGSRPHVSIGVFGKDELWGSDSRLAARLGMG